jgi:hypothetical protein
MLIAATIIAAASGMPTIDQNSRLSTGRPAPCW